MEIFSAQRLVPSRISQNVTASSALITPRQLADELKTRLNRILPPDQQILGGNLNQKGWYDLARAILPDSERARFSDTPVAYKPLMVGILTAALNLAKTPTASDKSRIRASLNNFAAGQSGIGQGFSFGRAAESAAPLMRPPFSLPPPLLMGERNLVPFYPVPYRKTLNLEGRSAVELAESSPGFVPEAWASFGPKSAQELKGEVLNMLREVRLRLNEILRPLNLEITAFHITKQNLVLMLEEIIGAYQGLLHTIEIEDLGQKIAEFKSSGYLDPGLIQVFDTFLRCPIPELSNLTDTQILALRQVVERYLGTNLHTLPEVSTPEPDSRIKPAISIFAAPLTAEDDEVGSFFPTTADDDPQDDIPLLKPNAIRKKS